MIQKLEPRHFSSDSGFGGATFSDVIDKVNEIIDAMNGEHDPADIYSEDGRLIAKEDESEDERIRKHIIGTVELYWGNTNDPDKAKELAYLEKQKEQKQEWSEEDERIRKLLIWQVHRNIEDETNDLAQSVYDSIKGHDPDLEESIEDWKKCLAWLKSLRPCRPSWKPSEEQLNALNFAITYFMHETNYKNPTELRELYDDLLELK